MVKQTLINFILDESGSMCVCRDSTISGFNEYIGTMKKQKNVKMSLTKFNSSKVDVMYVDKPMKDVKELSTEDFDPTNCTPLYDAIGKTITEVDKKVGKKKAQVLFVIMSDGLENDSKEYTREAIFKLIKEKEKKGWEFVYMGANQDSYLEGGRIGAKHAMNFSQSNMRGAFSEAACMSCNFTSTGKVNLKRGKDDK